MSNKLYFLALNRIAGVGPRTVSKLLNRWPNLCELFQLSKTEMINAGLPDKLAEKLCQFDLNQVEADLNWESQPDNTLLTWEDPRYPTLLKEIYDPPVVLYAKGDLNALQLPSLAVIGTRKPSPQGAETAKRFAFELAQSGLAIVSGLALGVDANAHQGCLNANGRTIAVMGTGVDCIYPQRHRHLAKKISENGLLLSEFPLKTSPNAGHFPRRNRIISGLSMAILVVEAAVKSGSLITARLALEQNRDVLAIPGSIYNPQTRGCHQLLKQGAKLVTCSEDILEDLNLLTKALNHGESHKILAQDEGNLVQCVGFEITTLDQIAQRSEMSVEDVAANLAVLELQGVVKAVPGGYTRCL